MTNEELLIPRFKVIGDYPYSPFNGYEILQCPYVGRNFSDDWEKFYKDFPNIFKPLEWWEDRNFEDLPKYLKFNEKMKGSDFIINGEKEPFVHKVKAHFRYSMNQHFRYSCYKRFVSEWKEQEYNYKMFLPSTEEEYLKILEK